MYIEDNTAGKIVLSGADPEVELFPLQQSGRGYYWWEDIDGKNVIMS